LWAVITKDAHVYYALGRFCIRVAGVIAGVRVTLSGGEKVSPNETYVYLSNHQSNADIPVLTHIITSDYRALMKKEVMRVPILSTVLRQASFVVVDRSDPNKAHASIDRGAELLRRGYSFIAFPEGTRSRNGRLGEFKKGVFIMAIKSKRPIVPITIVDSNRILPAGTFTIRPGIVDVIVHDPIPTRELKLEDRERLVLLTRTAIASALPAEENPLPAVGHTIQRRECE
jgi:1-acyl-sn-glycerol-3-phosphate acyltransferase